MPRLDISFNVCVYVRKGEKIMKRKLFVYSYYYTPLMLKCNYQNLKIYENSPLRFL